MSYEIPAKPTMYNGISFRSRLESKWAAFFDLTEWQWEYEPSEINGYNPDFIIKCTSGYYKTNTIIIEVKPSVMATKEELHKFYNKYKNVPAHLLFLTDMPFTEKSQTDEAIVVIGWGRQYNPELNGEIPPENALVTIEMKCENDFGSTLFQYDGMVHGLIERKYFLVKTDSLYDFIIRRWKQAGNMVQFKVKRGGNYE